MSKKDSSWVGTFVFGILLSLALAITLGWTAWGYYGAGDARLHGRRRARRRRLAPREAGAEVQSGLSDLIAPHTVRHPRA